MKGLRSNFVIVEHLREARSRSNLTQGRRVAETRSQFYAGFFV